MSIRVHGKGDFKYDNVRIGLNSRLDTIQAAILLPKLEVFKEYEMDERNKFAKMYEDKLKDVIKVPVVLDGYISSWAQYTLICDSCEERTFLQEELKKEEIPTMIYYPKPLHKQKVYKDYEFNLEDLKVAEELAKKVLSIPMHSYLTEEIIEKICNKIIEKLGIYRRK